MREDKTALLSRTFNVLVNFYFLLMVVILLFIQDWGNQCLKINSIELLGCLQKSLTTAMSILSELGLPKHLAWTYPKIQLGIAEDDLF